MFLKSNHNNAAAAAATVKHVAPRKSVPSVISADMNILGNIVSEGIVDFDGTVDGNIRCASLVLRGNGKVNGEIHAESVQIYGKVKGLIKAKSVHLYASSSVEGIIMHEVISIEDGATIDGKFKRTNKIATATTVPAFSDEEFIDETPVDTSASSSSSSTEGGKALEGLRLIAG